MDKLRAIKCFCRVVETRSFAAAAHELRLVPSVVSKAISTLEHQLGYRLLNRTTRRVHLTEAGALYYDVCNRLLLELEETERQAREGSGNPAGRLTVGLHPAVGRLIMSQVGAFLAAHPQIVLETTLTSTQSTLMDDELDVLVAVGELSDASHGVKRLGTTKHVIAASPDYLAAHGVPLTPDDLRSHAFLVSGRPDAPSFARWSLKRGSTTEIVTVPARALSRQGIYLHEACLSGAGIARLVEISIIRLLRSGELVKILPEWSFGELAISAVYPGHRRAPAKVRAFLDFAAKVVRAASRP